MAIEGLSAIRETGEKVVSCHINKYINIKRRERLAWEIKNKRE